MFERIKRWYKLGLWSVEKVLDAQAKGVLTEEEVSSILKEDARNEVP